MACRKQVKDLGCLAKNELVLLGSFSSEQSLRNEVLKMRTKIPTYYISKKNLSRLGVKEEITPQIYVKDRGVLAQGYLGCQQIKERLESQSDTSNL